MKRVTRKRYLEDVNEQLGVYLLYRGERKCLFIIFIPDYCRTQEKDVCCFIARFILKIKVCKCSKYNTLLIYMSLIDSGVVTSELEKLIFHY